MILLKKIFFLLLLLGELLGQSVLLKANTDSSSVSLGGSYELLSTDVPLGRMYSSLFTRREKNEINFTQTLPSFDFADISLQYLSYGFKKTFLVPWIRTGVYVSSLNVGSTDNTDAKASVDSQEVSPFSVILGWPIMFNRRGVVFSDNNKTFSIKQKEELLKTFDGSLNLNLYYSDFNHEQIYSGFIDFSFITYFAVPYVGRPTKLITAKGINIKYDDFLFKAKNKFYKQLNGLTNQKGLTAEDIKKKSLSYSNAYIAKQNELQLDRKNLLKDLDGITKARNEIYAVYNASDREMTKEEIIEFYTGAINSSQKVVDSISNDISKTFKEFNKSFKRDLKENKADEKKYFSKFRGSFNLKETNVFILSNYQLQIKNIKDYISLYDAFLEEETKVTLDYLKKTASGFKKLERTEKNYIVKKGDTWKKIALANYSNESYYKLILKRNNIIEKKKNKPVLGTSIVIPTLKDNKNIESSIEISQRRKKEKQMRYKQFQKKKNFLFSKYKNNVKQLKTKSSILGALYIRALVFTLERKISLYRSRNKFAERSMERLAKVRKFFAKKKRELLKSQAYSIKEHKKYLLKKELDFLNAKNNVELRNIFNEYKKGERLVFLDLLRSIYASKVQMINSLMTQEKDRLQRSIKDLDKVYLRKKILRELNKDVALVENSSLTNVEERKKKYNEIKKKFNSEVTLDKLSYNQEFEILKAAYKKKQDDFTWQKKKAELIYLSSEGRKKSLSIGTFIKNVGMPLNYNSINEDLPFVWGVDIQYSIVEINNFEINLYGNTRYYKDTDIICGTGIRIALNKNFSLKSGIVYEYGELLTSAGIQFKIKQSLMQYRLDLGSKFSSSFGTSLLIGLNIIL